MKKKGLRTWSIADELSAISVSSLLVSLTNSSDKRKLARNVCSAEVFAPDKNRFVFILTDYYRNPAQSCANVYFLVSAWQDHLFHGRVKVRATITVLALSQCSAVDLPREANSNCDQDRMDENLVR